MAKSRRQSSRMSTGGRAPKVYREEPQEPPSVPVREIDPDCIDLNGRVQDKGEENGGRYMDVEQRATEVDQTMTGEDWPKSLQDRDGQQVQEVQLDDGNTASGAVDSDDGTGSELERYERYNGGGGNTTVGGERVTEVNEGDNVFRGAPDCVQTDTRNRQIEAMARCFMGSRTFLKRKYRSTRNGQVPGELWGIL
ncbi:hypothetical protein CALCODRAFT_512503 [Calocera cornea HHB12733]|uniref:Uncharacterized protein n=1 Tax=Calocera cornea HHB12733 TaxID=1353952 RepID=A0A165CZY0_9BASI|nr:hypothetical protein CALCODRAFT_512503 [Calocera cornea HHB12733]